MSKDPDGQQPGCEGEQVVSHFCVSVSLFVKIKKWDNKRCFVGSCKVGELESKEHHGHRVSVGEVRAVTVTDGRGTTESTGSATSYHAYFHACPFYVNGEITSVQSTWLGEAKETERTSGLETTKPSEEQWR